MIMTIIGRQVHFFHNATLVEDSGQQSSPIIQMAAWAIFVVTTLPSTTFPVFDSFSWLYSLEDITIMENKMAFKELFDCKALFTGEEKINTLSFPAEGI